MGKTVQLSLADLAPEIDEAVIVHWHVGKDDAVAIDDDLVEIVTDKAAITVAAPVAGLVVSVDKLREAKVAASDYLVTIRTAA